MLVYAASVSESVKSSAVDANIFSFALMVVLTVRLDPLRCITKSHNARVSSASRHDGEVVQMLEELGYALWREH